jgi:hypothetical protein
VPMKPDSGHSHESIAVVQRREPPLNRRSAAVSRPLDDDPRLQERREIALAFHEVGECAADLRCAHCLRMMAGHRKIPISEHAIGGRAKLGREAAVIGRELLVRDRYPELACLLCRETVRLTARTHRGYGTTNMSVAHVLGPTMPSGTRP